MPFFVLYFFLLNFLFIFVIYLKQNNMKNPKTYNDLNNLQLSYMRDANMLHACGYPDDLFDDLYREFAKHLKEKK
jgi:hypothetical protein